MSPNPDVLPRSRTVAGSSGSSCTPSRIPVRRTHGRRMDTVRSLVRPYANATARLSTVCKPCTSFDVGEQGSITQLLQPKIVDESGKRELALIEGSRADR